MASLLERSNSVEEVLPCAGQKLVERILGLVLNHQNLKLFHPAIEGFPVVHGSHQSLCLGVGLREWHRAVAVGHYGVERESLDVLG